MKKFIAVLLCICLAFVMSGCITIEIKTKDDGADPVSASDTGEGSEKTEDPVPDEGKDPETAPDEADKTDANDTGMAPSEIVAAVGILSADGGHWTCPAQWNDYKLYFSSFSGGQCVVAMQKLGDNEKGEWSILENISCEITGCTDDKENSIWHFTLKTAGHDEINSLDVKYDRIADGFITADNYLDPNIGHGTVEYIFAEG